MNMTRLASMSWFLRATATIYVVTGAQTNLDFLAAMTLVATLLVDSLREPV